MSLAEDRPHCRRFLHAMSGTLPGSQFFATTWRNKDSASLAPRVFCFRRRLAELGRCGGGRFVFAALGRRWAVDRPWGQAMKSSDHNLVHIDGLAQAEAKVGRGKAPNARLIQHGDVGGSEADAVLSYAVMDLKNAYDWLWAHSWEQPGEGWEPETRSFEELGWTWNRPGQPPAAPPRQSAVQHRVRLPITK